MKGLRVYELHIRKPYDFTAVVYVVEDGTDVEVYFSALEVLERLGLKEEHLANVLGVDKTLVEALCLYYNKRYDKKWTNYFDEIVQIIKENRVTARELTFNELLKEVVGYEKEE